MKRVEARVGRQSRFFIIAPIVARDEKLDVGVGRGRTEENVNYTDVFFTGTIFCDYIAPIFGTTGYGQTIWL